MRIDQSVVSSLSLSGLAATFVGNGIGRFAYIALMPVLIQQAWFTRTEAASLGATTLLGYMLGVPLTTGLLTRTSALFMMRAALLTCSMSYLACAWQGGFIWFFVWRLLAGMGGAVAMVLAPNIVLSRTPASQRGRVSGIVFSGVGFGVCASGTVVPLFVGFGLGVTWFVLGGICLTLTVVTWTHWQENIPGTGNPLATVQQDEKSLMPIDQAMSVALLLVAYALNAVGYLPHTLFWVDYIVRELHQSVAVGGFLWAAFGIGAASGPFITGAMADRFGFSKTIAGGFLLKAFGVALPLWDHSTVALLASSVLVGMLTPGIAAIVSGYTMAIVGVPGHHRAWGWMTGSFAASQVVTGFLMVFIMASRESYQIVFSVSAWALLGASACILAIRMQSRSPLPETRVRRIM